MQKLGGQFKKNRYIIDSIPLFSDHDEKNIHLIC